MEFTHFDENGNAVMVDVTSKDVTERIAIAKGSIYMSKEAIEAILGHKIKKGDVLTVAQIAGIMGSKQTANLIPMCHPLNLTNVKIHFEVDDKENKIDAFCAAKLYGKTGVEMEALTGVNVALLTIYDMCKAIDKRMKISDIHLVKKQGGKSGEFVY